MPFDVCVYRMLWYFITGFFPTKVNSNGTGWNRAFLEGSEGLFTCTQILLRQCCSYTVVILLLVQGDSGRELWRLFQGVVQPFFLSEVGIWQVGIGWCQYKKSLPPFLQVPSMGRNLIKSDLERMGYFSKIIFAW